MKTMTMTDVVNKAKELMNEEDYIVTCFSAHPKVLFTFEDFTGFSKEWEEEYRDFTDEEGIDKFLEWLKKNAIRVEKNLYTIYHFENFFVNVGYTSFDI